MIEFQVGDFVILEGDVNTLENEVLPKGTRGIVCTISTDDYDKDDYPIEISVVCGGYTMDCWIPLNQLENIKKVELESNNSEELLVYLLEKTGYTREGIEKEIDMKKIIEAMGKASCHGDCRNCVYSDVGYCESLKIIKELDYEIIEKIKKYN